MSLKKSLEEKKFVMLFEVDPPRGTAAESLLTKIEGLHRHYDAVCVGDNPLARLRMSPLAMGVLLVREGYDVVMHLTCRDRTILALQSDVLGAWTLGIRNVLAFTGDPPHLGNEYAGMKTVFELNSIKLIRLLTTLNSGVDWNGKDLEGKPDFFIGAGTFFEVEKTIEKIRAGARFLVSQPIFEVESAKSFVAAMEREGYSLGHDVRFIVSVLPILTQKHAQFMSKIPGIRVPSMYESKLGAYKTREEQQEQGIALAHELIDRIKEEKISQGLCVMPALGRYDMLHRFI